MTSGLGSEQAIRISHHEGREEPSAAEPQSKKEGFHRRDTEFAEFGVYLNQKKLFTPRPLRLRGELPKIGATRANFKL